MGSCVFAGKLLLPITFFYHLPVFCMHHCCCCYCVTGCNNRVSFARIHPAPFPLRYIFLKCWNVWLFSLSHAIGDHSKKLLPSWFVKIVQQAAPLPAGIFVQRAICISPKCYQVFRIHFIQCFFFFIAAPSAACCNPGAQQKIFPCSQQPVHVFNQLNKLLTVFLKSNCIVVFVRRYKLLLQRQRIIGQHLSCYIYQIKLKAITVFTGCSCLDQCIPGRQQILCIDNLRLFLSNALVNRTSAVPG